MKNLSKLTALVLALVMTLALAACGGGTDPGAAATPRRRRKSAARIPKTAPPILSASASWLPTMRWTPPRRDLWTP